MKILTTKSYKLLLLAVLITATLTILALTKNSSVSEEPYTVKIVPSSKLEQEEILPPKEAQRMALGWLK